MYQYRDRACPLRPDDELDEQLFRDVFPDYYKIFEDFENDSEKKKEIEDNSSPFLVFSFLLYYWFLLCNFFGGQNQKHAKEFAVLTETDMFTLFCCHRKIFESYSLLPTEPLSPVLFCLFYLLPIIYIYTYCFSFSLIVFFIF